MKQVTLAVLCGLFLLFPGAIMADDSTKPAEKTVEPKKLKDVQPDAEKQMDKSTSKDKVEWKETKSGLKWVDLTEGDGKSATQGDKVLVHYQLWLADAEGGKAKSVQSSREPNPYTGKVEPFPFAIGDGRLIKGWNEGMIGMKPGTLRRLWIPSDLAWGPNNMGEDIPANSEVIFEIELLEFQ
jgi:FKBP-type peptidyl-prolyl cis-trans isomerase